MVLLYPFTFLIFLILFTYLFEMFEGKSLKSIRIFSFCCLYVSCTPLCANLSVLLLTSQIENRHCDPRIKTAIVLAGGITNRFATKGDWSALDDSSIRRTLFLASQLNQLTINSVIVSGGAGHGIKEAELMADLLLKTHPIGNIDITLDLDANNTSATADFVKKAATGTQESYYLVTSDWHMPRAQSIFAQQGIKTCPMSSVNSYVSYGFPGWFIPQKSALVKFERAWHEFGGLLWQAIWDDR